MVYCERNCKHNGCSIDDKNICMAADIEIDYSGNCLTYAENDVDCAEKVSK